MRSTFSLLPYINRNRVKADGTTGILCRITIDGKQTAVSTGIYCRLEDWNGRKNEIKSARENNRLQEYLRLISEAYEEILKSQGVVSAEILKNHITLNNAHPTTLLQMGEWEREQLRKHSEEIDSISSYRHSMYYQKYLADYLASFGKKDIALEEVTEEFGKSYKAYLKKSKNFGASQTNKCMCWLNRLLYLAVDRDIIRVNPCEDLEYETKPEARHKYISREEFKRILATPMYDKRQELARRAFIFSTLTGLAYVDIKLLHPHHIGRNAEGRRYIRINRKKTNVEAFVPLHPIAEQILSLYNTTDDEQPVFPLPSRDALWFDIHEMGVIIGKEDNLSYHQSRHSFGTFLISADIPIESIAKMMGHSNIRTTQGYARITDDKISKDMDKLMERRKKQSTGEKTDSNK
ncbi:site-specific integrase [uncultured Bacteroides sp.]|uniref:site-specific integrase n=1 Tax=uncultured Bacteroides sp. TaxID=162156 RepID=UPI0025A99827|nr:site-specific integrase [uncultured Bacteroides sp.]